MTLSFVSKRLAQIGLGSGVLLSAYSANRPLSAMAGPASIYDFKATDIDGNEVSLSKYANHVCIIVNVASK